MPSYKEGEEQRVEEAIIEMGQKLEEVVTKAFEHAGDVLIKKISSATDDLTEDIRDALNDASTQTSTGGTNKKKSTTLTSQDRNTIRTDMRTRAQIAKSLGIGVYTTQGGMAYSYDRRDRQQVADQAAINRARERADKVEAATKARKQAQDDYQRLKKEGSPSEIAAAREAFKNAKNQEQATKLAASFKQVGDNIGRKLDEGLSNLADKLDNEITRSIQTYSKYQSTIEARLQGVTSIEKTGLLGMTSRYNTITQNLNKIAFSPLLSAEDLYSNLNTLIQSGVVTNVEQRALLMTMKDDIVSTFDVNGPTLRKLIRVQQEDSTAARMGMESYLNRFLNEFVESTEYLTETFDSVAASLYEASSLLSSRDSSEFEYVVQKWLGTLTGVGLDSGTAQSIAQAINDIGSGNVSNVGSGVSSLLVMAASNAGKDYADLLNNGLSASDANTLLASMTEYLLSLSRSTSNVVKNQLAQTFGVKISDLRAVSNLSEAEINAVSNSLLSYGEMYGELANQFDELKISTGRTSVGKLLSNAKSNFVYQTGMNVAANPALNAMWQITDLIQSATGGINIPSVFAFGTGGSLNTTIENLMKLGIAGAGSLGAIGGMITSIGSVFKGSTLLDALDISSGNTRVSRGSGTVNTAGSRVSGEATSASDYVGNSDSSDYADSALNSAKDSMNNDVDVAEEDNKSEDEVVVYLREMQFTDRIDKICDDVHYLKDTGIKVTSIPNSGLSFEYTTEGFN